MGGLVTDFIAHNWAWLLPLWIVGSIVVAPLLGRFARMSTRGEKPTRASATPAAPEQARRGRMRQRPGNEHRPTIGTAQRR